MEKQWRKLLWAPGKKLGCATHCVLATNRPNQPAHFFCVVCLARGSAAFQENVLPRVAIHSRGDRLKEIFWKFKVPDEAELLPLKTHQRRTHYIYTCSASSKNKEKKTDSRSLNRDICVQ